jgi:hypothetical protein
MIVPISQEIIEPIIKTNIQYVNSLEDFEQMPLGLNEVMLRFDNNQPCFYVRERDKFGEYSATKIYFYETFAQKVQSIEKSEFVEKCKNAGLTDLKIEIACMFFLEGKKPLQVWEWVLRNTDKQWEWDYVRGLKYKLKKKIFQEVT